MADSADRPLRSVPDTNVVVAGPPWSGAPRQLFDAAVAGQVELFTSAVLLDELAHSLGYPKFAARIKDFGTSVASPMAQYSALVSLIPLKKEKQC